VRFFRIPAFTGIETHRDDADRGSLRVVEGCVPHGPGGLRSGPVWENLGAVGYPIDSDQNSVIAHDDGNGNSVIAVARTDEVHELMVISTEHTEINSLGASYQVVASDLYKSEKSSITPIGNRMYAVGDGSAEATYLGKGPITKPTHEVFPNQILYDLEWSRFPNCQFYVQGPKKTIFAAGNPDKPLTVYISEPAGLTNPYRDSPYSTELTAEHAGVLSTVDILSSNASRITALSTRGDQVVVHTDKGCHLLYSPQADQASTGFRVEQVPATNFSGAVNSQVVAGESGSQHFWMGHDGQIYKDEAASRGAEDFKGYADAAQANWKAKGTWEKEHPIDLSDAFATYDPQSGMYWVYTRSDEFTESISDDAPGYPINLQSTAIPDEPGVPENLQSSLLHDAPGTPTNLQSSVAYEAPGTPQNLQSSLIPDAPGVPQNLTSSLVPDVAAPGVPTNLNSTLIIEPGTPENLNSSLIPDAPGVPTNLQSAVILPLQQFRNSSTLKIDVDYSFGGNTTNYASNQFLTYSGLMDRNDITIHSNGTVQLSSNPSGQQPSWFISYQNSNAGNYIAYIIGNSSGSSFSIWQWPGVNPTSTGQIANESSSFTPAEIEAANTTNVFAEILNSPSVQNNREFTIYF
jgi:hypothetical protein